jgi:hypothetical protein
MLQNGGTFTDGGQRLQVTGDTLLKGSGNGSGTTALTVQNSDGTNMLRVKNNGEFSIGSNANDAFQIWSAGAAGTLSLAGLNATFYSYATSQNSGFGAFNFWGTTLATTSGFNTQVSITRQFAPTSGSAQMTYLNISPTINQVGATGITRGISVNPNLTAAADWRSIEWSNNSGWGLYGAGTANNYLGGNLLIGTTTNVASSILTLASTTKGFLPPRMTTTQKNAISSPAAGLVVYDTTLNKLCVFTTAWETITSI